MIIQSLPSPLPSLLHDHGSRRAISRISNAPRLVSTGPHGPQPSSRALNSLGCKIFWMYLFISSRSLNFDLSIFRCCLPDNPSVKIGKSVAWYMFHCNMARTGHHRTMFLRSLFGIWRRPMSTIMTRVISFCRLFEDPLCNSFISFA